MELADFELPSLSAEMVSSTQEKDTFAHCYGCNMLYHDDVFFLGSILCPNCREYVLVRGLNAEQVGRLSDERLGLHPMSEDLL